MGHARDDEGGFMSDKGSSRRRFQGDDQHYGPRSLGSTGRDRDDQGRFMSEGESRSRARYDDDDDRYSRRSMGQNRDNASRYERRGGSLEGRETAAGMAIPRAIPRLLDAGGTMSAMAKVAGTAKVTRKRHAAVGKAAGASVSRVTRSVLGATTRPPPAADRNMPMTPAITGAAMTMATADAGMAAGRAIWKAIRKPRAAAGRTVAAKCSATIGRSNRL